MRRSYTESKFKKANVKAREDVGDTTGGIENNNKIKYYTKMK